MNKPDFDSKLAMRCLIVVQPLMAKLARDGLFLMCLDLAEALVDLYAHHVYFWLPSKYMKDWQALFPEGRKGITPVFDETVQKYRLLDRFHFVNPQLIAENFSRRYGKYQVDWVYCVEPEPAPLLRVCISDTGNKSAAPVPVFIQETNIQDSLSEIKREISDEAVHMNRAVSFLSGYPIFLTEAERQRGEAEYSLCLSPAALRSMRDRTLIRPMMLSRRIEAFRYQDKYDTFTAFFGGRISPKKNPEIMMNVFQSAHALGGDDFTVKICAPNESLTTVSQRQVPRLFGKENVRLGCGREDFWAEGAKCHVALSTSEYEGFGMGFLELLRLGVPVVLPRAWWSKEMYPDWYPWWYKFGDITEGVDTILKVRDQYRSGEIHEWLAKIQAWLDDFVGTEKLTRVLVEEAFQQIESNHQLNIRLGLPLMHKQPFFEQYIRVSRNQQILIAKALLRCRGKKVTLNTLTRIVHKLAENFSDDRMIRATEPRIAGDYDMFRMLRDEWGLLDDTTSALTTFVVPENFIPPLHLLKKRLNEPKET